MVMSRACAVLREEKRYASSSDGADRNMRPDDQVTLCRKSSVREPTAHALEAAERGEGERQVTCYLILSLFFLTLT